MSVFAAECDILDNGRPSDSTLDSQDEDDRPLSRTRTVIENTEQNLFFYNSPCPVSPFHTQAIISS